MNLIPATPGLTPSYWCTWGVQTFGLGAALAPPEVFERDSFHLAMRNLDEQLLFGANGWASHFFAPVRADLFLVFDVGWDVPRDTPYPAESWRLGSLEVDVARFPSCGGTPPERLRTLNALVQAHGWRGAGLWVSPQLPGDNRDGALRSDDAEAYWRERARWCRDAGIGYWKVDIGARSGDAAFRRMLACVAHEEAPGLWVEQGTNSGPFNDIAAPWDAPEQRAATQGHGRFGTWGAIPQRSLDLLAQGDTFRTYDVTGQLSVATTLDRVAFLLAHGRPEPGTHGLINCEDEPYLGAALGCALGIMRHPLWQEIAGLDYDPAKYRRRMDEVTRAVRWQRIAPAWGADADSTVLDARILTDAWHFARGQTWAGFVVGTTVEQGAPARLARNMPLPMVHTAGEPPFVVATRHPNGAIAVAALPRTINGAFSTPPADVTVEIDDGSAPVGIFGDFGTLTLTLSAPLGERRVWAQDLAGEQAHDVTERIGRGQQLVLTGAEIAALGTANATPGDLSAPGLLLVCREPR